MAICSQCGNKAVAKGLCSKHYQQMRKEMDTTTITGSPTIPGVMQVQNLKVNLGAGQDIMDGYINVDLLALPGIDVVHNLLELPYPFGDNSCSEIIAKDVLEHLPNYTPDLTQPMVIAFIEEMWRILQPGGKLFIQTPRYDAEFLWLDPTHVRGFHEQSLDFFDPEKDFGKSTGFYSPAKFQVTSQVLENKNLRFWLTKRGNDEA